MVHRPRLIRRCARWLEQNVRAGKGGADLRAYYGSHRKRCVRSGVSPTGETPQVISVSTGLYETGASFVRRVQRRQLIIQRTDETAALTMNLTAWRDPLDARRVERLSRSEGSRSAAFAHTKRSEDPALRNGGRITDACGEGRRDPRARDTSSPAPESTLRWRRFHFR